MSEQRRSADSAEVPSPCAYTGYVAQGDENVLVRIWGFGRPDTSVKDVRLLYSFPPPPIAGAPNARAISDAYSDWAWEKEGTPVGLMLPNESARTGFFAGAKWASSVQAALTRTEPQSVARSSDRWLSDLLLGCTEIDVCTIDYATNQHVRYRLTDDQKALIATSVIEGLAEQPTQSQAVIVEPTAPTHPRHNVYFMCQCCEEEDPEHAVCCREDIGVMPDGTWLCDNCYSDCEKTAYGMVANDVDDFEFPRFEDLPRPAPYIDSASLTRPLCGGES